MANDAFKQRMAASRKAAEEKDMHAGEEAGRKWAEERAEYPELKRLAAFHDGTIRGTRRDWAWENDETDAYGPAHRVLAAIDPDCDGDRSASDDFWEAQLGDGCPDGALLEGFVSGALAAWEEVKDEV